ncbi:hypothetical protein F350042L8_22350 [Fusobacterium ulcerans]
MVSALIFYKIIKTIKYDETSIKKKEGKYKMMSEKLIKLVKNIQRIIIYISVKFFIYNRVSSIPSLINFLKIIYV